MRLAYVCERYPAGFALGGLARRRTICDGLKSRGYELDVVELSPARASLPWLFRFAPKQFLRLHLSECDAILLEGAAIGLHSGRFKNRNIPIYVDVCDSLAKTARFRSKGDWAGIRMQSKKIVHAAALRLIARSADCVMYISQDEILSDRPGLRNTKTLCVPNAVFANVRTGECNPEIQGTTDFVALGDFSYLPNQEMFHNLLNWAWANPEPTPYLTIVGPNVPDVSLPPWVLKTGWVEDPVPYLRASIAMLAPLDSGAGVKNKVLESMSLGVPVFGTDTAFEGIDAGAMALDWNATSSPDDLRKQALSTAAEPGREVQLPAATESVAELVQEFEESK